MTPKNRDQVHHSILAIVLLFVGLAGLNACTGEPSANTGGPRTRPPAVVTAAAVKQKDMPITVNAVGNVEAYNTVNLKSQVAGVLTTVYFKDGQDVKEGDLLFSIDEAPYQVALRQAEANLARDLALAQQAQNDFRRNTGLLDKGAVSEQTYEGLKAKADSLDATVKADKAMIEKAKLDIGYCSIKAPISGRTGSIQLRQGTLVKANDDARYLVSIAQVQPVYVNFSVPEKFVGQINAGLAGRGLTAAIRIPESPEDAPPIQGQVTFVDNAVDVNTGTILLKATVPNEDRRLWPGVFVNVTLTLGTDDGVIVVPNQAVQNGQSGQFVFVLGPENTAEFRPVVVARLTPDEAVIKQGLKPGETVITDGQINVIPGAKVSLKDDKAGAPTPGIAGPGGGRPGGPGGPGGARPGGAPGSGKPGEKPDASAGSKPGVPAERAAGPGRANP